MVQNDALQKVEKASGFISLILFLDIWLRGQDLNL